MGRVSSPSFAIVPEAVLFADVSHTAKVLWAVLAWCADRDGYCYPGATYLAEALGVSTDTVRRSKRKLADAGLLTCEERFDDTGRRISDDIQLGAGYARVRGAPSKNAGGDPGIFAGAERTKPEVTKKDLGDPGTHAATSARHCHVCGDPKPTVISGMRHMCENCYFARLEATAP